MSEKEYVPTFVGTVTKYVFVESPNTTPDDLAVLAYEISKGAMIKETCFGLQVTGDPDDVERIISRLRAHDPDHIFVKDRGFPPGDPRRCRANLGGARPGYFGHEFEMGLMKFVSYGLTELHNRDDSKPLNPPSPGNETKMDVNKLKKMMASEVP